MYQLDKNKQKLKYYLNVTKYHNVKYLTTSKGPAFKISFKYTFSDISKSTFSDNHPVTNILNTFIKEHY